MPIGSAISAVGSIIAGDRVSAASAKSARETNAYNRENYKHRYQWQVEDMRKAGLNPALSYTTGAGTPTGGVQQTEFGGSQYNEASKQIGSMMSKASAQALQREQVNNAKNMNEQIKAQINKINADAQNVEAQTAKTMQDTQYQTTINKYLDENQQRQIEKLIWDTYYANPYRTVTGIVEKTWQDVKDTTGNLYNSAKDSNIVNDIKNWIFEKTNDIYLNMKEQKGSFWNKKPFAKREKKK